MVTCVQGDSGEGGIVRRAWQVACVCLLGVFLATLVTSLGYALADAIGPGPGFFPFWLSAIGMLLTGAMLVQLARGQVLGNAPDEIVPNRRAAFQAAGVLVALAVATALLEPLGFRLTMLPFIAGLLVMLGARSLYGIALCAVAGSFGVFHVFHYWLRVPLPIGALGI
jgi:putative tricarboxylic transport membrane protein